MVKSFFITAFRTLRKHKLFTIIHLFGLTLAFTVAVILFLTAMFEFSYDDFHINKDKLYQVYLEAHPSSGIDQSSSMSVPFAVPNRHLERNAVESKDLIVPCREEMSPVRSDE